MILLIKDKNIYEKNKGSCNLVEKTEDYFFYEKLPFIYNLYYLTLMKPESYTTLHYTSLSYYFQEYGPVIFW